MAKLGSQTKWNFKHFVGVFALYLKIYSFPPCHFQFTFTYVSTVHTATLSVFILAKSNTKV